MANLFVFLQVTLKNKNRNRPRIPLPKGSTQTEADPQLMRIMQKRKERSKEPPATSNYYSSLLHSYNTLTIDLGPYSHSSYLQVFRI